MLGGCYAYKINYVVALTSGHKFLFIEFLLGKESQQKAMKTHI